MTAAPPGTVIMTIPTSDGSTVVATITYDPATGNFTTNPAISAVNNSTESAVVGYTNLHNGSSQTVTVSANSTLNLRPQDLNRVGIQNIADLNAALGQ